MAAVESLTVKAAFSFVTNGVIAPKHLCAPSVTPFTCTMLVPESEYEISVERAANSHATWRHGTYIELKNCSSRGIWIRG
jgi:hypothetical protein